MLALLRAPARPAPPTWDKKKKCNLIFDVRTDTNDNGGGKVREYRCPARHRIVPYKSIRKRAGLGHECPHDLRHTFVTRMLDLGVPIEQVNYLAGHKSMAMTKRYDHANEERYGAAIEALDAAGKTGSAEALAAAKWKRTYLPSASAVTEVYLS